MLECLPEWKPGFFQFCSFLNIRNNLNVFYNHLVLTGRLSTHFDSIFTKNPVFTLPNTLAVGIFMRVEIGNWHLKKEARVYSDHKLKCAGPGSLRYKNPSNNYCSNPYMSGNRLPWIIIFLIDVGMPLCHDVDAGVYEWPFHLNSPRFLCSQSQ